MNDARVLCRHLGFEEAVNISPWTKEMNISFAISMKCSGSETSPIKCSNFTINQVVKCNNSDIIGLVCRKKSGHSLTTNNITLVKGSSKSEGRVEVERHGLYGTICSDGWDMRDANVLCRMQGFAGAITAYKSFGEGTGPVWLSGLDCKGNEMSIEHCKTLKTTMCNHSRDAGVSCYSKGELKGPLLVNLTSNASSHYGKVQIIFNNISRTICGDQDWDIKDAHVVCRMLGFPRALAAIRQYAKRSGGLSLPNVRCNGDEKTIEECDHGGWDQPTCSKGFDAGIICERILVKDRKIKVFMTNVKSGMSLVEIQFQGVNGTLCAKDWDLADAHVVCGSSSNSRKKAKSAGLYTTNGNQPILLSGLKCLGSENSINECQHLRIGSTDCHPSQAAGISCKDLSKDEQMIASKIIETREKHLGQVQLVDNSSTKDVCDYKWDIKDAHVICKMQGYSNALAAIKRFKRGTSVQKWAVGVECSGNENSIAECYISDDTRCPGNWLAGILCKDSKLRENNPVEVRLMDGNSTNSGRLEVRYGNIWGTVCDSELTLKEAHVVCRTLGYLGAQNLLPKTTFRSGSGIIWLTNVSCSGSEESIDECKHPGWGQSTCSHKQDVGITCKTGMYN
ncbi:hypothetical protein QZH41_015176 [Actinostola sp. cb2023]|nr:hypothetical protein QZH41_015176 [Actinostola sp. cb2023]